MKTFIRRPGNKTRHLKHIVPLVPKFTGRYIEPFLGTGALYLHLLPEKAILNDLNEDVINIWKLVRDDPEYIITEIDKFKKSFLHLGNKNKLKICKEIVSKMNVYTGKQRTVNYLLMIYCSFNSCIYSNNNLYISGLNGNIFLKNQCHVFTENYREKLSELKNILKNVKIENKDYRKILQKTVLGDFVFLDPPYIEEKTYLFNYNKNESFDIINLLEEMKKLDEKKVKWMMTQIDTPRIRSLFKKYKFVLYNNNSNYRGKRTSKKELIITNY